MLLSQVKKTINEQVGQFGVVVDQFGYIGGPRPPQQVQAAIDAKIAAIQNAQRAENEIRQSEAEAKKRVVAAEGDVRARIATAEAEAQANKLLAQSLTVDLIKWREPALTEEAVKRWNGQRPMIEARVEAGCS